MGKRAATKVAEETGIGETPLRILIIEDEEADALLLKRYLEKSDLNARCTHVATPEALTDAFASGVDWSVALCDHNMGAFDSMQALQMVRAHDPNIPFIIVSGVINEEKAADILRLGAHDLVPKDSLSRLAPAIERELSEAKIRREKALAERRLGEERALLHNLMSNMPDAIYFKDREHRYIRANEREAEVLNAKSAEAMIGKRADDFIPVERAKIRREEEKRILVDGEAIDDRVEEVARDDGTVRWYSATKAPIRDEKGAITGLVGITRDVTDHKIAENALRTSEERFRGVVQNSPSAIALVDRGGRFLLCNNLLATWMNAEEADIVGKLVTDLFHAEEAEEILRSDRDIFASGQSMSLEAQRTHLDGVTRDVVIHKSPIRDDTGKVIAVSSIITDVTEGNKAAMALSESEQRLSLALEGAEEALWDWDLVTGEAYFSAHLYEMLALGPNDIEPRMASWQARIHPDDKANAMAALNDYIDGRRAEYIKEYRVKSKAGQWLWISDRGRVVAFDPDGRASRVVGTYTDVTERKRSEQALRESEQRFRDFAEAASDWFWEMGPDLRFTHKSEQFSKITGFGLASVLGKRRDEMASGDLDGEHWKKHLADLEAQRPFHGFEYKIQATDGRVLHISTSGIPVFDESTNFRGYRGTGSDITARVEAENQIRQHDKMDSIGNLAGGIAHDFNNMLQPIMGLTQRVLRGLAEDNPDRKRLEMVLQASERARELVKQILTFSRKENQEREHVDPGQVTREVLDLLRSSLPSTIEIEEEIDDGVGSVFGDASQISTALMNLAVNAADAMEGKPGRLTFSLSRTDINGASPAGIHDLAPGSYALIRVTDTGMGMDEATLKRVFDPFFTTKEVGRGTGLGLAVVHGVVIEHGGAVGVTSEIDEGTAFDLYFPVSETADTTVTPGRQMPSDTESMAASQSPGS